MAPGGGPKTVYVACWFVCNSYLALRGRLAERRELPASLALPQRVSCNAAAVQIAMERTDEPKNVV